MTSIKPLWKNTWTSDIFRLKAASILTRMITPNNRHSDSMRNQALTILSMAYIATRVLLCVGLAANDKLSLGTYTQKKD
jgi:hypothetical protein